MLVMIEPKVLYEVLKSRIYVDKGTTMYYDLNANGCWMQEAIKIPIRIPQLLEMSGDGDYLIINSILNDDRNFCSFIQIPLSLQRGYDVFVMVYNGISVFKILNDIIFKLVQKRYGYNYQIVNSCEDLNLNDTSSFTTPGILTLDQDIQRYEQYLASKGV